MRTISQNTWSDNTGKDHINDIYIVNGQFGIAKDKDACGQVIASVIRTVKGELQLDVARGIPYFTTVFTSRRHLQIWANAVKKAVNELTFVKEIKSFEYEVNDSKNTLYYEMTISTIYGEVTVAA